MTAVRIAFDPALPVKTAGAFDVGDRKFSADEPFDWRELGLSEADLANLYRAGYVYFLPAPAELEQAKPKQRKRATQPQPTE